MAKQGQITLDIQITGSSVIGSSSDSEQVFPSFKWIPLIVFEKWTLTKNLT